MSLGRFSIVISLPRNWTKPEELKKEENVCCAIQQDCSLVIYPSSVKRRIPKEIALGIGQDENETIVRVLGRLWGAFLNWFLGFMPVSKKNFSIPQRKAIRNIVGKLYMRIVDSD